MCIITMGLFATLGGFGSGWLLRFTTSYVMVLVCIGGLEVGSLVFLIAWERQPSISVIVVISAIFGICYGLNATIALGECHPLIHIYKLYICSYVYNMYTLTLYSFVTGFVHKGCTL